MTRSHTMGSRTKPGTGKLAICRVGKGSSWKVIQASRASEYKGLGWAGCGAGGVGYAWTTA